MINKNVYLNAYTIVSVMTNETYVMTSSWYCIHGCPSALVNDPHLKMNRVISIGHAKSIEARIDS